MDIVSQYPSVDRPYDFRVSFHSDTDETSSFKVVIVFVVANSFHRDAPLKRFSLRSHACFVAELSVFGLLS